MRILVPGAKGILGRAICHISSGAHTTIAIDIDELDITRKKDTDEKVSAVKPDVIVNCAAYTDVDGCESNRDLAFEVNAGGVKNLAEICLKKQILLVHISTDYIFDGVKKSPYREDDSPHPLGAYGASKLEGERILRQILPEDRHLLIRSQWLFGEGGKNFVDTIRSKARHASELKVVNDQFGSPTWAGDLARAILRLIEIRGKGVYHVANKGIVSWYDFARKIMELSGLSCVIVPQTTKHLNRPAPRPSYSVLDCSKFERDSGMALRSWEEALKDYVGGLRPFDKGGNGGKAGRRTRNT